MAKRKRLSPANPDVFGSAPETKSMLSRPPIADVASEAAATAALDEVSRELTEARNEGRMILSLDLDQIAFDHLVRDRVANDTPEFDALVASIGARGQQMPIEVMETAPGQYGLISGWRRCQALVKLTEEGQHNGTVMALLRQPADASDAYLSMIEENEMRVGLSYFERARIALKSVEQGVFETEKAALLSLFRSASRAKRSKIRSFIPLVHAFDGVLRFPHRIGERLGLQLAAAIDADPAAAKTIVSEVAARDAQTAETEAALLSNFLNDQKKALNRSIETKPKPAMLRQALRKNLSAEWERDSDALTLSGEDMTPALRERLFDWLKRQP